MVTEAQTYKPAIEAFFVVNRRIANTAIGRDVVAAFEEHPFSVLKATLSQRVAFAESFAGGLSVLEAAPGSSAAMEIDELVREIAGLKKVKRRAS
jgi:chromosome partitioning protein